LKVYRYSVGQDHSPLRYDTVYSSRCVLICIVILRRPPLLPPHEEGFSGRRQEWYK
jgi:hypothetical protein